MFKIGEFSQLGQVSVRMLRHYDKLGLLNPEHIDPFTGYRYYKLDQLSRLNRILALKDLGLSLDEIARLLDSDLQADQLEGMLLMKQAQIQQHIHEEQRRLERVAARLRQIKQEDQPSPYDVIVKDLEPQYIVAKREIVPHIDDMKAYRCGALDVLYNWLKAYHIEMHGFELAIYHMGEFVEDNIDMEMALPIADNAAEELAGRTPPETYIRRLETEFPVASTLHRGSIIDIPQAVIALARWVADNALVFSGAVHEYHLSGPEHFETDFNDVTFELQVPITSP